MKNTQRRFINKIFSMIMTGALFLNTSPLAMAQKVSSDVTGTGIAVTDGAIQLINTTVDNLIDIGNVITDGSIQVVTDGSIEVITGGSMEVVTGPAVDTDPVAPDDDKQEPQKVKELHICSLGSKKAELTWEKAEGAEYYLIYRKKGKSGTYKKIAKTKQTHYINKNLSFGVIYKYQVVPCRKGQEGEIRGKATEIRLYNKTIVSRNHQKYTYAEMKEDISLLCQKYYGIATSTVIGRSEDNRNIYDLCIGKKNAKKTLLVVSTLHAREYMCSLLCMNQIEYYLKNYNQTVGGKKVKSVLNDVAIHYIPMANPDGVSISQHGFASIRNLQLRNKLRRMGGGTSTWKANGRGVDLNRNFAYKHSKFGSRGSSGYSGSYAMSEKESQAIAGFVKMSVKNRSLKGAINYHAMGSIVFGDCRKKGKIKKITNKMYKTARSVSGYASSSGYSAGSHGSAGNFREYLMYKQKVPNITVEIGHRTCPGPISEFPSIWKHNAALILKEAALFVS